MSICAEIRPSRKPFKRAVCTMEEGHLEQVDGDGHRIPHQGQARHMDGTMRTYRWL